MSVHRVSRRANADPLIQELNVGDAAEPQGRGTGQPSLNSKQRTPEDVLSLMLFSKFYNGFMSVGLRLTEVQLSDKHHSGDVM